MVEVEASGVDLDGDVRDVDGNGLEKLDRDRPRRVGFEGIDGIIGKSAAGQPIQRAPERSHVGRPHPDAPVRRRLADRAFERRAVEEVQPAEAQLDGPHRIQVARGMDGVVTRPFAARGIPPRVPGNVRDLEGA
jgi:hypothetical protein